MKYCKHCGRLNPDDTARCISCVGSDFEPTDIMPKWLADIERELQIDKKDTNNTNIP